MIWELALPPKKILSSAGTKTSYISLVWFRIIRSEYSDHFYFFPRIVTFSFFGLKLYMNKISLAIFYDHLYLILSKSTQTIAYTDKILLFLTITCFKTLRTCLMVQAWILEQHICHSSLVNYSLNIILKQLNIIVNLLSFYNSIISGVCVYN